MSDINFLTARRRKLSKTELQDKKRQKYALIFSGVAGLVFVVSLIISFLLTNRLKNINQRQKIISQQITSDQSVELAFLIFSNKLKIISELYQNRTNKQEAIDYFSSLFGGEVFLSGMDFGEDGNVLSLSLTSDHIFSFEETVTILDSEDVKQAFSSVQKSGLRRDEQGSYNLDISVELKKEGDI